MSTSFAKALYVFAALTLLWVAQARAQDLDHKDYAEIGNRLAAEGKYLAAADQFALAYGARPKKLDYAAQAAEYYQLVKDYAKASEYYEIVREDDGAYPLAGLNYARALKQQAKYEEAVKAYLAYLNAYDQRDRSIIEDIVKLEVRGAELARQEAGRFNSGTVVESLGATVNTSANELAPMPLAPTAVYYISDAEGATRMYRSNRNGSTWTTAGVAEQFPRVPGKNVGSGALNPVGDRFYVSLCGLEEYMPNPTARCELYVIVRGDAGWNAPRPLPPYINTAGNSTTTPFLYQEGDREVMLFASDRIDGYGGFDLYRTERYLDSEGTDFSFPENLGPVVNSVGDEVTPHYDPERQELHFASNGHVSLGGFDLFKTLGRDQAWNEPENLLPPLNGPADEYYYRPVPESRTAVFASNRATEVGKSRTSHEDLFLARPGAPSLPVDLLVVDSATSSALPGAALAVYVTPSGETGRRLIVSELSDDGYFSLLLPLGATVEFDVQRLDYRRAQKTIRVPTTIREGYQLPPVRLARTETPLAEVQRMEAERTDAPVATLPAAGPIVLAPAPAGPLVATVDRRTESSVGGGNEPIRTERNSPAPATETLPEPTPEVASSVLQPSVSVTPPATSQTQTPDSEPTAPIAEIGTATRVEFTPGPSDGPVDVLRSPEATRASKRAAEVAAAERAAAEEATTRTSPTRTGRSYRIQIEARRDFDEQHRRYDRVRGLGTLTTEHLREKDLHRVLVGDFADFAAAQRALQRVRNLGWDSAFIAAFDGPRYVGLAVE